MSRSVPIRLAAVIVAAVVVLTACGSGGAQVASGSLDDVPVLATSATEPPSSWVPTAEELVERIVPLGSAAGMPRLTPPAPIGFSFEAIGVELAGIIPVGVEPSGEMEIPGAAEIGWYRHGPTPGDAGSSVLAAHVAYNGRDGVFRRLGRVEAGQRFAVFYDDGSIAEFEVVAVVQYPKDELPIEAVFASTGDPTVTLITCGGSFNRSMNSYDDNIVAYAVPVSDI